MDEKPQTVALFSTTREKWSTTIMQHRRIWWVIYIDDRLYNNEMMVFILEMMIVYQ